MYKVILLALSYVCPRLCPRDHSWRDLLTVPILDPTSLDFLSRCVLGRSSRRGGHNTAKVGVASRRDEDAASCWMDAH